MLVEYLKSRLNENKLFLLYNRIPITLLNPLNIILDLSTIIKSIERSLKTFKFFKNVEEIYIGKFDFLKNRQVQALFVDGCIYISNFDNSTNINNNSVIKDIIHEVGHSIENDYGIDIYGDGLLEMEYMKKKRNILSLLTDLGYIFPEKKFLMNSDYQQELDKLLYVDIGYGTIAPLIVNLFISPYAITSIREYFASGFETFYLGDKKYLKNISPVLFKKLTTLDKLIRVG